jgi:hypothetical protein
VLEDAGELMTGEARKQSGQALSRLLNEMESDSLVFGVR